MKNTQTNQSRKWQLTINNPLDVKLPSDKDNDILLDCPFNHDEIKARLNTMTSIIYWCMADEIGTEGTPHTHIFFVAKSPIRFSTIKNKFPTAHIEPARGSCKQNRDYITKTGEHLTDEKIETSVEGTFEEFGDMPNDEPTKGGNKWKNYYDLINQDFSIVEIINLYPEAIQFQDKLEKYRQMMIEEKYSEIFRKLEVTYIYGKTETGKTRSILDEHGYKSVYRVTDYSHPFDRYKSTEHKVLVFDEFHSSLQITQMLMYLEGYPTDLNARYNNKVATYDKVYIVSNLSLEEQYPECQCTKVDTWNAFLRRINCIKVFGDKGEITTYDSVEDYYNRFEVLSDEECKQIELMFNENYRKE